MCVIVFDPELCPLVALALYFSNLKYFSNVKYNKKNDSKI